MTEAISSHGILNKLYLKISMILSTILFLAVIPIVDIFSYYLINITREQLTVYVIIQISIIVTGFIYNIISTRYIMQPIERYAHKRDDQQAVDEGIYTAARDRFFDSPNYLTLNIVFSWLALHSAELVYFNALIDLDIMDMFYTNSLVFLKIIFVHLTAKHFSHRDTQKQR